MRRTFLQSEEWERFQRMAGRRTWRIGGNLVMLHGIRRGFSYLYSPHPAFSGRTAEENFFHEAGKLARREKSIFLKVDLARPLFAIRDPLFVPSRSLQPSRTSILDLGAAEEELFARMHPKTRYNIRLAERKGVVAERGEAQMASGKEERYKLFWNLLQETARRDGFHTHEESYYRKLLDVRSPCFSNELFFAAYKGKVLAAAIINFYSPEGEAAVAAYLHGASSREERGVMAPHLLHWGVIREAKARGCGTYDLWGIDEKRWPGVTRFKKGFGGTTVEYPGAVDMPCRPWMYRWYAMARRFLKN